MIWNGMRMPTEQNTSVKSVSFRWKLAIFLPIAAAFALQVLSQLRTDTHVKIMLSVLGNLLLTASLIAQSLSMLKRVTNWGVLLLIVSIAAFGYALHVLLHLL